MNKKGAQHSVKYQDKTPQRLDVFAAQSFGFSRSKAQKLIKNGNILVNDSKVLSKYSLQINDEVSLSESQKDKTLPSVPIIYEDDVLIVIDKPSGTSVHPAPGEKDPTIIEVLDKKLNFNKPTINSGVVHRLDKGTSGVMIIAKDEKTQAYFQQLFKSRKVNKTYLALICGHLVPKAGIIEMPLKRDLIQRGKMGISQSGKKAKTRYKVIAQNDNYSYLEVKPETGRTHQIRVHLSSLGYPIVGDKRYGAKTKIPGRMFLHAHRLDFIHPVSKKRVHYTSQLPQDLKGMLKSCLGLD